MDTRWVGIKAQGVSCLMLVLASATRVSAQPAPAQPAPAQPATRTAGYEKGFFLASEDGHYKLVIQGRVQARYAYASVELGPDKSAFSIERARLTLKGHVFSERIEYNLQTDFGKGVASLKDFYVDYVGVSDVLVLRVGQWKRPFSRQQITSSGSLELVDRAITDKAFGAGRDIGLGVHNAVAFGLAWQAARWLTSTPTLETTQRCAPSSTAS